MIVVDTSALVAILTQEPESDYFLEIIGEAQRRFLSAVTFLEIHIVMRGRHGQAGLDDLAEFLAEMAPEIIPFDAPQARLAAEAFNRYGKGIDPKAKLNLCASYALACAMNAPLLFKGNDFSGTDVKPFPNPVPGRSSELE